MKTRQSVLSPPNPPKSGRYRYFQLIIDLGLGDSNLNLAMGTKSLIEFLKTNNFVSQSALETTLYKFKINVGGRNIQFSDFYGQLERDQDGSPYWKVFLKTNFLTTPRVLAKKISEKLFPITDENKIDPKLKIQATPHLYKLDKKHQFLILDSDWSPGYFTRATSELAFLLTQEEIKEYIKQSPTLSKSLSLLELSVTISQAKTTQSDSNKQLQPRPKT